MTPDQLEYGTSDEHGWYPIDTLPQTSSERVLLFYPSQGKGFEAFQSFERPIYALRGWWKPTHWRPALPDPVKYAKPKQEVLV